MKTINEDEFDNVIKGSDVIIQLSADWCGPCKVLTPTLEAVANEKNIDVFKVNIDNNPRIVKEYNIRSIPRVLFIKNGKISEDLIGNQGRTKIEATCKKVYEQET